ncbi:hypothetical protein HDU83_007956, partial [Entophlyctis luteolus]
IAAFVAAFVVARDGDGGEITSELSASSMSDRANSSSGAGKTPSIADSMRTLSDVPVARSLSVASPLKAFRSDADCNQSKNPRTVRRKPALSAVTVAGVDPQPCVVPPAPLAPLQLFGDSDTGTETEDREREWCNPMRRTPRVRRVSSAVSLVSSACGADACGSTLFDSQSLSLSVRADVRPGTWSSTPRRRSAANDTGMQPAVYQSVAYEDAESTTPFAEAATIILRQPSTRLSTLSLQQTRDSSSPAFLPSALLLVRSLSTSAAASASRVASSVVAPVVAMTRVRTFSYMMRPSESRSQSTKPRIPSPQNHQRRHTPTVGDNRLPVPHPQSMSSTRRQALVRLIVAASTPRPHSLLALVVEPLAHPRVGEVSNSVSTNGAAKPRYTASATSMGVSSASPMGGKHPFSGSPTAESALRKSNLRSKYGGTGALLPHQASASPRLRRRNAKVVRRQSASVPHLLAAVRAASIKSVTAASFVSSSPSTSSLASSYCSAPLSPRMLVSPYGEFSMDAMQSAFTRRAGVGTASSKSSVADASGSVNALARILRRRDSGEFIKESSQGGVELIRSGSGPVASVHNQAELQSNWV